MSNIFVLIYSGRGYHIDIILRVFARKLCEWLSQKDYFFCKTPAKKINLFPRRESYPREFCSSWRCCILCMKEPHFLSNFCRLLREEFYDPWSIVEGPLFFRSSNTNLLRFAVSTTGICAVLGPFVFLGPALWDQYLKNSSRNLLTQCPKFGKE